MHLTRFLVGVAAALFLVSKGQAQDEETPPPFLEREPPRSASPTSPPSVFLPVLERARADGGSAWIPRVKTWAPGSDLRVCFLGNNHALNAAVAAAAAEWNEVGADVTLNFGSATAPRRCQPGVDASIRVAYNNGGYNWSRYGKDAVLGAVTWNEPSMHLDLATITGSFGRSTIIHEFGHALGLFHEHQKPISNGCETEFNWPVVYQQMLRWNGWDEAMVDSQVRPVREFASVALSEGIDRSSVMLYSFTPNSFARGASSHCYIAAPNGQISSNDAAVLRAAYDPAVWQAQNVDLGQSIAAARARGDVDVARALALYTLPKAKLDDVAATYEAQQAYGFNPQSGQSAQEQLTAILDEVVQEGD